MAMMVRRLLCKVVGHRAAVDEAELWAGRTVPMDPFCPRCYAAIDPLEAAYEKAEREYVEHYPEAEAIVQRWHGDVEERRPLLDVLEAEMGWTFSQASKWITTGRID